jgi:hypothetical protein
MYQKLYMDKLHITLYLIISYKEGCLQVYSYFQEKIENVFERKIL